MLNYIIPLIGSYFTVNMVRFWWLPFIVLSFFVTVPVIIFDIFRRRSHV